MFNTPYFCIAIIFAVNIYVLDGMRVARNRVVGDVGELASIESDSIIEGTRGKRISMRCIVNNVKSYKITWYFKGVILTYNNIRIRNDKRITIENPTPNEWILIIDGIDSSDEGYYSCRLDNGLKKFMHLIIGIPPKFIGEHNGNHVIVNTVIGENVTLSCVAQGNPTPTIYWYRRNKMVSTGPHLHLLNVSRFAHSEYECVARNKIEPAVSRRFRINVNFQPILNMMYTLLHHTKSAELQVLCEIFGNPIHSIQWFKNGVQLEDESANAVVMLHDRNKQHISIKHHQVSIHTQHLAPHKYVSKLRLKNANEESNGKYECVVGGFLGNKSSEVMITEISNEPSVSKTAAYKELTFDSTFLGRGARSNITKVTDESYTQNLSASGMSSIGSLSYKFLSILLLTNLILINTNIIQI